MIVITFFARKTYQRVGDKYYLIPILIIVFLLNTLMISFSRTKTKVLMEINNISPYKIIIITGLFGLLLNTIILTISTIFLCEENSKEKCQMHILKDESDMKKYYDNYFLYFSSLDEQLDKEPFYFFIEILLIMPLYSFLSFIQYLIEILMIFYLNPIFILLSDSSFFGSLNIISFFANEKVESLSFILRLISSVTSCIGYCLYLEIIELRFLGLNKNTKKSIYKRAKEDSFIKLYDDENSENEENEEEETDLYALN
jgi:hypothetical protein